MMHISSPTVSMPGDQAKLTGNYRFFHSALPTVDAICTSGLWVIGYFQTRCVSLGRLMSSWHFPNTPDTEMVNSNNMYAKWDAIFIIESGWKTELAHLQKLTFYPNIHTCMLYSDMKRGSPSLKILIKIFIACSRNDGYCGDATIACKNKQSIIQVNKSSFNTIQTISKSIGQYFCFANFFLTFYEHMQFLRS